MTTETRDLLVEIGTEELPPKALQELSQSFSDLLIKDLENDALLEADSVILSYASPRRLSMVIKKVRECGPDRPFEEKGPSVKVGIDENNNPTKALIGFANKWGVDVNKLERRETPKGEFFYYKHIASGSYLKTNLDLKIKSALRQLPIPKRMRWGEGDVEFARPVHWIVVLYGNEVIECEILGVQSGNKTYGHRYHHPQAITLNFPSDYVQILRDAKVWLNDRKNSLGHEISNQASRLANNLKGIALNSEPDSNLVAEIAALVEWPVAISGNYDPKFLQLPEEILIATLEDQQRYFPVRDKKTGKLLPYFIAIANIESKDTENVRRGNERVIVPRLTDAMFFWNNDRSRVLASHRPALDGIIFQKKLGSIGDKVNRVKKIAVYIAGKTGGNKKYAEQAAQLAKCDLLSDLVGEFPELQGTMGRYLALNDGEPDEVARAIAEHYLPRFAGDHLPVTSTGQALAIADKLDTIAGIFAIGQGPTGEKDPFGLRRAALGCLRIMIECKLRLDLFDCLEMALKYFPKKLISDNLTEQIFDFMMDRLRRYYLDNNISADTFDAVISRRPTDPYDFHQRIIAVTEFRKLPEAESLAIANKRISNILKQANSNIPDNIENTLLSEPAEKKLATMLEDLSKRLAPVLKKNDYSKALTELAALKQDVDTFFDQVMVMCDDESVKNNRLALLRQLNQLFLETADISRLQNQI